MNATHLASLISKCVLQILEKPPEKATNETSEKPEPYDNAYFFILFVMLFYSFLALTVFFGYIRSKKETQKKDPYEEFIDGKHKKQKWGEPRPTEKLEKFDFEEESIP
ncbi:potassium voltage-gated channel subfamily E member 3 [Pelobates cultripes]|uniref:Potassium voltage-gated channel subfamily E member 3 n=1 Tax=Pelobates cultripes TaxID=61616 RepID=A0AAD1RD34_PELCU|nr:potassium voltage-gated channel subfamily E member 3 [Pelobates cultripes]